MPKLVVVDHSFHQKTKSSDFFLEILREEFELVRLWDEGWRDGPRVTARQIESEKPDVVLFWQSLSSTETLRQLNRPVVWAPMYDDAVYRPWTYWRRLRAFDIKIVSFSQTLARTLRPFGFSILELKYYPEPQEPRIPIASPEKSLFIWNRIGFGPAQAEVLFRKGKLDRAVIKNDLDPGFEKGVQCPAEIGGAKVRCVQGFLPSAEYRELIEAATLCMAPRKFEGIGMSFLEAMARGAAVCAVDRPTMNEYIEDGITGYLFPYRGIRPIDLSGLSSVRERAWRSVAEGHAKWLESSQGILPFLRSEGAGPRPLGSAQDRALQVVGQLLRLPIWLRNKLL